MLYVFNGCVRLLERLADWAGLSYAAVNVWLFCVLWPLLTAGLLFRIGVLQRRLRRLRAR